MKTTATFNIDGSFKITGRGLVIFGEIVDGKIGYNNFITFHIDSKELTLRIKGIDFLDRIDNTSKVGLTFHYENNNQRENLQELQLTKQTATIFESDN